MADHNAAEAREETGYNKLRRSSRNRAVIDQPQGDIITSEAVKAVRIMGNRCSNCACACSVLNCEAGTSTPSCKATPGSSNHQTRRRTGNSLASRKIEVITLSDSDEDATTVDWDSSSSEGDIQVIEESISKHGKTISREG